MKRIVLFCCVLIIVSGLSFAADFSRGPDCLKPGSILISTGLNLGYVYSSFSGFESDSFTMIGFPLVVEYALPKFGFTIGGETGYTFCIEDDLDFGIIPIMGRFGYHPDLGVKNLDIYALAKIGLGVGLAKGDKTKIGFGYGFGVGARYFFTGSIGVFSELGFDSYSFKYTYSSYGYSFSSYINPRKWLTVGLTFKL
jgi:hypothetical protein